MKKIVISVCAPLALTCLLGMPALATTQASDSGQMSNMNMGKMDHKHHKMGRMGEKHADVSHAIHMLDHAKMMLQRHAAEDPGGHKAEAIKAIDSAVEHLQMAMKADQK